MKTWWMGAGLLAAWMATAGVVHAQGYLTTPYGAARYPDPIPCGDSNPPLTPGPLTPLQAPPGPGPDLSLDKNASSAFPCGDPIAPDVGVFFHAGALGLKPNRMGDQPIAVYTPDSLKDGTTAAPGLSEVLDSHDVETNFMWGVQGSLGVQDETRALEFTGFYLFERTFTAELEARASSTPSSSTPPSAFPATTASLPTTTRSISSSSSRSAMARSISAIATAASPPSN